MIFVTGGTGMLGAHLLYLLTKTQNVIALKRPKSSLQTIRRVFSYFNSDYHQQLARITWVDGDISDFIKLRQQLQNMDIVYHAAALVSFNPKDSGKMYQYNVLGTENVVNACLHNNVKKLCYVSSIAALGSNQNREFINEDITNYEDGQQSAYSKSKKLAELEVWRGINEGLNAVIVNPAIILGGGNWANGSGAFFQKTWDNFKYYTHGATGFVDVNDVCKAMILLTNSEISNERFVLSAENLPYRDIFNEIAKNFDKKAPSKYATPWLTQLAWRLEKLRCLFTRKAPQITKETAQSGHNIKKYNGEKILRLDGFEYTPIQKSIKTICHQFLTDKK
jgi:dihydroflavonol-4-reductase